MSETTTIRISRSTHEELLRLANERHQTIADTVSRAVRLLHQDDVGHDLATALTAEETAWLDADAG